MTYKDQILSVLNELRLNLVTADESDEWWCEEVWRLDSRSESGSREYFVTFLIDPEWTTRPDTPVVVWRVRVSTEPLADWLDRSSQVAELDMVKGRFDGKLAAFRDDLRRMLTSNS